MIFGNFFFTRAFRFTGAAVTAAYIDLNKADGTVIKKILTFSPPDDAWMLTLTEEETLANVGTTLFGHIVCVVATVHSVVAFVAIPIKKSYTARLP